MKRTRITAILTALSLMVSGLPMTSVYAAELPEAADTVTQEEAAGEETPAEDSTAEDTDEKETDSAENGLPEEQEKEVQDENDVTDEPQQGDPEDTETTDGTETADDTDTTGASEESRPNSEKTAVKELKAAENVKMAGSNGVLYDDVAYLSAGNVLAMDEEMQEIYRDLCDEVAVSKEGGLELQDVVFAVDTSGDLYYSYYMPMIALEEIQAELLPDTDKTLTPEEEKDGETSEDDKDAVEEEKKDGETAEDDKDAVEEKKDDETSEDDKDAVEEEKKDDEASEGDKDAVEEEKKDDETSEDDKNAVEEEKKDDETAEDGEDAEASEEEEEQDAESVEDEQDAAEEGDELFEENLDLIPEMEEETFEEIESVRVENTIDLGYGSSTSEGFGADGIQFNSILPAANYFEKQLTAVQKKYYGYLKGKLLSGSNKVSFTDSRSARFSILNDMAHATSALILTYPDKTDWMAKPGGVSGVYTYKLGSGTANYTFTFDKSKFYSGSLDSQAKAQVVTLASQAQQYAADRNSGAPVYDVIAYFDRWVCNNGYYDNVGMMKLTGHYSKGKELTPAAYLKSLGYTNEQINATLKKYYECHSAYGILLKGYGVCESYAKAMSRLLDAVGIPNIYVVGSAGGVGHAWNYVQMPNGNWYLLDSTWNDSKSSKSYLLAKNDGDHLADGRHFSVEKTAFTFEKLAGSNYSAGSLETITLSQTTCDLIPKEKVQLTYKVGGKDLAKYGKVSKVWSSSNTRVAKVDQKGNVTAVAGGTAKITFTMGGMSKTCTVNVYQIKAVRSAATNKASESVSLGNTEKAKGSKTITLTVDRGDSPQNAQWMFQKAKTAAPTVTCSKKAGKDVVTATDPKVSGDTITFTITAVADNGSSTVKVKFGGKAVTIKVTVGTVITQDMFDITWPAGETAAGNKTYVYTGRAIRPTVKKKTDDAYKQVRFKVSYVNNVNAGANNAAKLIVTGTGKYGGVLEYPFTIKQVEIKDADFSKALKSKVYNGGNNPPATVVKLGKKTLKANKDYEILYSGKTYSVVPAGKYTISIRGIGNYTGTVGMTQSYEVTTNTIAKVSVAGAGSVKYTGVRIDKNHFKPKIGKNLLPDTDYTITWYQGQGRNQSTKAMTTMPVAKGKYTAVIKVKGNNLINTAKKTEIKKNFTIK